MLSSKQLCIACTLIASLSLIAVPNKDFKRKREESPTPQQGYCAQNLKKAFKILSATTPEKIASEITPEQIAFNKSQYNLACKHVAFAFSHNDYGCRAFIQAIDNVPEMPPAPL